MNFETNDGKIGGSMHSSICSAIGGESELAKHIAKPSPDSILVILDHDCAVAAWPGNAMMLIGEEIQKFKDSADRGSVMSTGMPVNWDQVTLTAIRMRG